MPQKTILAPMAELQLLTREQCAAFHAELTAKCADAYDFASSVIAGSIGIKGDLLERAVRIANIFQCVCRTLHAELSAGGNIAQVMLQPFDALPTIRKSIIDSPFCLAYFRMDFFLDVHDQNAPLKIMEINSGGSGLTDFLRSIRFLEKHHNFHPPRGRSLIDVPTMLKTLLRFAEQQGPLKTFGFAAIENGCDEYMCECLEYAAWMRENTAIKPVLLTLTNGELSLLQDARCPCPIQDVHELDVVFADWFEDLPCLEQVEKQLQEYGIRTVPARSDLPFEQKGFLSLLQNIEKPAGVSREDWDLLQAALLPSFPLTEYRKHVEEMRNWPGIVLKMDVDCASENVFIFDFHNTSLEDAIAFLERTLKYRHQPTWSVQRFLPPPHLPIYGSAPSWIPFDYASYKYDLMTYLCYEEESPSVLFGSRCYSRDKWDELTEEGIADGLWAPVSVL